MKKSVSLLLLFLLAFGFSACSKAKVDIWQDALYTQDTQLGSGEKTVLVEVIAGNKSVTFTIRSDKATLGDALSELGLIEGEQGAYGLYVKKVNGIKADYDENQCYWGFNKDGQSMMTGVDATEFKDGEHYELVYTKL